MEIYYHRLRSPLQGWQLWVWDPEDDRSGRALDSTAYEGSTAIFRLYAGEFAAYRKVGLLPRLGDWEQKDGPDRFTRFEAGRRWHLMEGDAQLHRRQRQTQKEMEAAFVDSRTNIHVILPPGVERDSLRSRDFHLEDPTGHRYPVRAIVKGRDPEDLVLTLKEELPIPPRGLARLKLKGRKLGTTRLQARGILQDPQLYETLPMGLTEDENSYWLRCFAPVAEQLWVLIYASAEATEVLERISMHSLPSGAFEVQLGAKLKGCWYSFEAHGADFPGLEVRKALDPYSRLHGGLHGPTLIFPRRKYVHASGPQIARADHVIWETHIRDFSMDPQADFRHPGLCSALLESPRLASGSQAGLEHLRELGINTVHLLPFQDFHHRGLRQYDWGYMPVAWFAPESWYSPHENSEQLLLDYAYMIEGLHEAGFKVVMDVVFNHTAEPMPPHEPWSFNALAPGYYYRRNHTGHYFNGSGCGNEFRSEARMARRLIVDCLKYWSEDFGIDGFRFDLMGLMDWESWKQISEEMSAHRSDLLLYGEPWAAGGAGVEVVGKGGQRGLNFSVFNDHFRDAIRGDNSAEGRGFVQSGIHAARIGHGLLGGIEDFADHPVESINYAACHDNYTLRDKLWANGLEGQLLLQAEKLTAGLVLLSQGIPFLHAGQEMGRSKQGCHNSWNQPDSINAIQWGDRDRYGDLFTWHKDLIRLRSQHRLLRLQTGDEIRRHVSRAETLMSLPETVAGVVLRAHELMDSFKTVLILANGGPQSQRVMLPEGVWKACVRKGQVQLKITDMQEVDSSSSMVLQGCEFVVLVEVNRA